MFKNIANFFYQILNLYLGMLKINRWSDKIYKLKFLRSKVFILRNCMEPP
jgi:hypothetical protein